MDSDTTADIGNWTGAIGPQSEDEPLHYDLEVDGNSVKLIGPLGALKRYDRTEFEQLVSDGEWILADVDFDNEVYHTPNGEIPW